MDSAPDTAEIVFRSRNRRSAADAALVLEAAGMRPVVHDVGGSWMVVVAPHETGRARQEIEAWQAENPPRAERPPRPVLADGRPGVAGYIVVIVGVAIAVANFAFGRDWLEAGRIDGAAMRAGEWWRALTALTLHADLGHLAANLFFGSVFGGFAGRYLGSGVAWLLILLAGVTGNVVNVTVLGFDHRAIGASTAVFAALGLLGSLAWSGRRDSVRGWVYRWGPIIAAVALLAFTGTGGERTDIGAHLWGFAAGLGAGLLAARLPLELLGRGRLQASAGLITLVLLGAAWAWALAPA
jgi:rhomboid protease GluP